MCGIWGVLGRFRQTIPNPGELLEKLKARGPEYTDCVILQQNNAALGFTRLAINGLTSAGNQPFQYEKTYTVCNGEIYNYKQLAERWGISLPEGTSDCAVLPHLAKHLGMSALCRTLDGVFAFLYADLENDALYIARDPYGVRPLFHGIFQEPDTEHTTHVWSSEIKGLPKTCTVIEPFPPGTWCKYKLSSGELLETQVYHQYPVVKLAAFSATAENGRINAASALREALTSAVKKRLLSDRPIGALLSGGVDSSLIAAIAARELAKTGKKLHTFSIGMPGSTDLEFAQKVADHIGSVHHNVLVKPEDFLAAIPKVIEDIESYDITSVRASVGNWLIGKFIKEHTDIKVVFNGDGSDEIGGGYIYFYAAPSDEEYEEESNRLLREIHMFDVLRSDRSMAAHGLEARTPFLDKNVVATWRAIDTAFCRPIKGKQMEKQILREAFEPTGLLPTAVLWRKKEAFSDGVSSAADSWYKRCSEYAKSAGITMQYIEMMKHNWHNPPKTEEAFYYRRMFEECYGVTASEVIPHMWMPRWVAGAADPSARTLKDLY